MRVTTKPGGTLCVLLAAGLATVAVAGCGSSSKSTAATTTAATQSSSSSNVAAYTGPESKLARSVPVPTKKAGVSFKIGFLSSDQEQIGVHAESTGAAQEAKAMGGSLVAYDAADSPTTQVNQFDQLLASHPAAILLNPVNAQTLIPELKQAKQAGIPVVASGLPATAAEPVSPYALTDVLEGDDQRAYLPVAALAAAQPHASFTIEGFGIPVPILQYQVQRIKYWAAKLGLKFLGEIDAPGDSSSQYYTAAANLITRYPSMDALVCFNDDCAKAAASAARTATHKIKITGSNGDPDIMPLIESGQVFDTALVHYGGIGKAMADAAYDAVTKQHLPLPRLVNIPVVAVTAENAANVGTNQN